MPGPDALMELVAERGRAFYTVRDADQALEPEALRRVVADNDLGWASPIYLIVGRDLVVEDARVGVLDLDLLDDLTTR